MNDFKAEPEELRTAELAAVGRVLHSGWYVLGNEVKAFEKMWAERCGIASAVGVGNGMDAIEIGLRALDIGEGDEVITTPMTAFATVLAIIRAGATPVLADIDPETALLDPASVERCIGPRTRAMLLVHLYGQIRDMERWAALCDRHGIALLEDCAQSHLAQWNGKTAGGFGLFGAYSFYPTKNLGALGDAGALVCNSETLAQRAAVLRNYGQSVRYHHTELGLNSRLDELQAALLQVRLNYLDVYTARRRAIATAYREHIVNPGVRMLAAPLQPESHVYHLFVLTSPERDRLAQHLKSRGVETYVHYPVPVHRQPPCKDLRCDPNGLAAAERHAAVCLSIPCHPQMSDADVNAVIEEINAFQ
ncbi:MAG: DegT/DnrJ/EryC1/StrS family aminotransferase [Gallionella sp.]|nr:DegT/DnrJ/EryC1/StrS family aminotransferase [Gallionella sp.]MCK9354135.1 DegT/DnrJ/EryC1/StrS family aminotransferase [Gallionella sp.]